ncbi:CFEM domain-containing protein [Delitschia confertaspora ATCC 74209]|uniref:CFEM domain-containing protein n=1 Tax=Delitschia confertaspora ATCC 74209 TaxID=1513339 RepID=A0A9P4MTZ3_9PLEO|nr:CFEM domain-containing protein [Delitschia confertaspora ATCC 74209]
MTFTMRQLASLIVILSIFLPFVAAQRSLESALTELPACALKCLSSGISQSPCAVTDETCICSNQHLMDTVTSCVKKACTVKQSLITKNLTATTCGAPIRDRSGVYNTTSVVLGVISAICVFLRLVYKLAFTVTELGWDDCFIVVTLFVGIPSTIMNVQLATPNGLGKDIWTLPYFKVTNFLETLYVMEVLYFAQVPLLKLSLLFFYQRIFPGRPVRRLIWATIALNSLYGVVFIIVAIFQCQPISFYWTSWDGEHTGQCININALSWANAVISIVLDIWMLAIPLSQLIHLKLAWKKKVQVSMMFCTGIFVTIVSILRLQSLVHFGKSTNPTWDQYSVMLWSTVEINVGIMCACMPAIRVMLVRIFPTFLGSSRHATEPTGDAYYAQKSQQYGSRSRGTLNRLSRLGPLGMGRKQGGLKVLKGRKDDSMGGILVSKDIEVEHEDYDDVRLVKVGVSSAGSPNLSREPSSKGVSSREESGEGYIQ